MTTAEPESQKVIRAAGGLLWRQCSAGRQIAVVHRKGRHDDWTLPKGKLEDGETWLDAAIREVQEETAYDPEVRGYAGAIGYQTEGAPKVVRFWHMEAHAEPARQADDEVAEVVWLPAAAALKQLQYQLEQALVEASLDTAPSLNFMQSTTTRWRRLASSVSLERLRHTFHFVESDLDAIVEAAKSQGAAPGRWHQRATKLIDAAKRAASAGDAELGWKCLKAADRNMLFGLDTEQLRAEADPLLAEASDDKKGLTGWRKTSIQHLLCDSAGKLKDPLAPRLVARAKRILDEHQDNVYQKLTILRRRLLLLTVVTFVALVAWLISPPLSLSSALSTAATSNDPTTAWFMWSGVILCGLLGALFSGFATSISAEQKMARIPSEISASTVTFARLAMGAIAAIGAAIFLLSGLLNIPTPSYEILLAAAFASGFSERLLLQGMQSLSK